MELAASKKEERGKGPGGKQGGQEKIRVKLEKKEMGREGAGGDGGDDKEKERGRPRKGSRGPARYY